MIPEHGWGIVIALLAPVEDQVRAYKILDRLLEEHDGGSNVSALFARSRLAANFGDLEEAFELANQAIKLEPERADLLAWSGRLAINLGDEPMALSRYRSAWEASPSDVQIAMAYAELLKRSDDLPAAQAVLAQLPDTPDMRFARIIFAIDAGDRENAEALYAGFACAFNMTTNQKPLSRLRRVPSCLITRVRPSTGTARSPVKNRYVPIMRQAFLLAGLGDIEGARNLLAQLRIRADTELKSQSYQAEAQILQDAGNRDKAFEVLNTALETLPDDIPVRYSRALLAVGLGQLELAESDLRQIISVDPDNAAAINALGYTLADLTERYDEAEELILLAYELQPDDPSIIDSMGWISYRLGRLAEAETYMREAWRILRNAEIAAHLGEVLWVRGQKDEARSTWQLGLELESDNEILISTMQRFGELP